MYKSKESYKPCSKLHGMECIGVQNMRNVLEWRGGDERQEDLQKGSEVQGRLL